MNITENAKKKLVALRPNATDVLYVARKAGGCSGFTHVMGFSHKRELDNNSVVFDELTVEYPQRDTEWFATAELDFKDGLDGTGFTWDNAAKSGCCGCKKSFC